MKKWFFAFTAFLIPHFAYAAWAIIPNEGEDSLYSKFQTGDLKWSDIIAFGFHIIQLLISMAGVFAVILLMIGGFQIVFGATMDDQESGKTTVKHTLIGFVVIVLSWIIVDLVVAFLTSSS